jgi:hypothetical protein
MIPLNSCHSTVIYLLYIFLRDDGSPYSVRHLDPREVTWLLGVLGHMSDVRCRPTQPALVSLDTESLVYYCTPINQMLSLANYGALRSIYLWAHSGRQTKQSKERLDGCSS